MSDLRGAWEEHAAEFVAWARKPGHDSYWLFHRDAFLPIVPAPGRRTLDLGCGEGRLSRDLKARGFEEAVRENARVLEPGGRLCFAVVHPISSAGSFESDEADSRFVIEGS